MPDTEKTPENAPKTGPDSQNAASHAAAEAAALAEAFLDLWQRNIAAWAADARSGPPLVTVDGLVQDWLRKNPRGAP